VVSRIAERRHWLFRHLWNIRFSLDLPPRPSLLKFLFVPLTKSFRMVNVRSCEERTESHGILSEFPIWLSREPRSLSLFRYYPYSTESWTLIMLSISLPDSPVTLIARGAKSWSSCEIAKSLLFLFPTCIWFLSLAVPHHPAGKKTSGKYVNRIFAKPSDWYPRIPQIVTSSSSVSLTSLFHSS